MNKASGLLVLLLLVAGPMGSYASLVGDTVVVERRFGDNVHSSRTVIVSSDPGLENFELISWQSLYVDISDYDIKLYSQAAIGYIGSRFNGFDFRDLDFAAEGEVVASVDAYYVSKFNHNEVISHLDPERLSFSDNSISLDLGGIGIASHPLNVSIQTRISEVPLPPSVLQFLLGFSALMLIRPRAST